MRAVYCRGQLVATHHAPCLTEATIPDTLHITFLRPATLPMPVQPAVDPPPPSTFRSAVAKDHVRVSGALADQLGRVAGRLARPRQTS